MAKPRRKQSEKRKSPRTRAVTIRASFGGPAIDTIVKKIRGDAKLLLHGDQKKAQEKAQEVINNLVVDGKKPVVELDQKVLFLLSCVLSVKRFPGYASLDSEHIKGIDLFIEDVKQYISDVPQKRPLNFLMLAAPGAGKSHFIKCIALRLQSENVAPITFNMACLQRHEDLIPPLDAARNLKVQDRIPLLFLDEFDSNEANTPLLLPLLWDGELNLGQRDLKLGKVIIVLAGSHPNLQATMNQARSMKSEVVITDGRSPKLVDLLSRINGGTMEIPPFEDAEKNLDRRYDKVCIAVELLRQRFPTLRQVSTALLRFLAQTRFRYGVRSIANFINMIPYEKKMEKLEIDHLRSIPLGNTSLLKKDPLASHLLHDDHVHGVADTWKELIKDTSTLPVHADALEYLQAEGFPLEFLEFHLGYLVEELSRFEAPTRKRRL